MTLRRLARLCALAAAMSLANLSGAGVWGSQPVVGIVGDYYTNPALIDIPNAAETHTDLLVDAPTSYVADAYKLTLLPSFRISNAQGYSLLDSNYQHLSISNEFDGPRDTLIATTSAARDSSLYRDFLLSGSTGVKRDTVLGDVTWDRHITERLDFNTDASWTRAQYAHPEGAATLTDYKYTSVNPALSWAQNELTKLNLSASVGRYDSLDGATQSVNANLQLGITKQLSEIWTLSASAGYSRANNRVNLTEDLFEITPIGVVAVPFPIGFKSTQNGNVYSVTLNRKTSLLSLTATASRQLAPTGFAFLSREEVYEVKASYTPTERWTLSTDAQRLTYNLPEGSIQTINLNVNSLDLSISWQCTEHWTATVKGTRVMERYVSTNFDISSSGVSIEISRQFDWKSFH